MLVSLYVEPQECLYYMLLEVTLCSMLNVVVCCRMQFGGLGQLCDGVLGGDDFMETKELRVWPGYDYLGWSREALGQGSVDIEFHFEKPRVFHSMQVGREKNVCECVLRVLQP